MNKVIRYEFIFFILYDITSCYNSEVKVYLEYELYESYDKELVDQIIKIEDTIIIITKAKREDINQEVG